jgi:hypothetical protein
LLPTCHTIRDEARVRKVINSKHLILKGNEEDPPEGKS